MIGRRIVKIALRHHARSLGPSTHDPLGEWTYHWAAELEERMAAWRASWPVLRAGPGWLVAARAQEWQAARRHRRAAYGSGSAGPPAQSWASSGRGNPVPPGRAHLRCRAQPYQQAGAAAESR
jgi:hypothetical protein